MLVLNTLKDLIDNNNLEGKKVIIRVDFNVPIIGGKIADMARIERTIPTIKALTDEGARVIIISHFGRPKGEYDTDLSLAPIADSLCESMGGVEVKFAVDCIGSRAIDSVDNLANGEIVVLENLRFHKEEKENDPDFARQLADLADFYVNDAFSCSHREHSSIVGISEYIPAYAGILLESEISYLSSSLETPDHPVAAMVGGSKISTKIEMLENLVQKVDYLMIGGGMANTLLYAKGFKIGKSICEKDLKKTAIRIFKNAEENNCRIMLPSDLIVAKELKTGVECEISFPDEIPKDGCIFDIGPRTVYEWAHEIEKCNTVVWNGPVGVFEVSPFDVGSISLARVIADLTKNGGLKSVAGGGDILATLTKSGLRNHFTYVSTAGGAFLEWLEGKTLPGIKILLK